MKQEDTIDFHIRRNWYKIMRIYNIEAAKQNGTMPMAYALLSIDIEEGTPSTSLGPIMGMESRSLTRILKKMEDNGLIERHPNPDDGRGVIIRLTEFGREKRAYSKEKVLIFNETIRSNTSEEKLNHFYEVSDLISDMISNKKIYDQNDK